VKDERNEGDIRDLDGGTSMDHLRTLLGRGADDHISPRRVLSDAALNAAEARILRLGA
jgi:hypothetical protein